MMLLPTQPDRRPTLLLVDDEPTNLQVLRGILQAEYRLLYARDGATALKLARDDQPDLVLLDVMMPGMSGHEVCRALKTQPATAGVPVIFVTALTDAGDEAQGFDVGAVDYITKPVSPPVVRARVRTQLSLVHTDELRASRLQIVQCLGRAAEYKDNETGRHVIRMSLYAQHLALAAGCHPDWSQDLLHAAPMHDIGKIGIPDAVLLKPGPLDAPEWEIMRTHAQIGAEIIGTHPGHVLQLARSIALAHHEKWDGSGYPHGLAGEAIPLEARICAIVDVFDALTSTRPYKKPWSVADAVAHIQSQAGQHFEPRLVDLFVQLLPALLPIQAQWAD